MARKFTTCSYIRTTLRSVIQTLLYIALGLVVLLFAIFFAFCMFHVPIAAIFSFTILKGALVPCFIGWIWVTIVVSGVLFTKYSSDIRKKLSERQNVKLSLLEQRIKDGKEGICTIVEVV